MSFNRSTFTEVCDRSGFTKRELAHIYGTTRQTIYDWRSKSAPTQLALAERAEASTKALITAIRGKLLPFPRSLTETSRAARIDLIIKTVMESVYRAKR